MVFTVALLIADNGCYAKLIDIRENYRRERERALETPTINVS